MQQEFQPKYLCDVYHVVPRAKASRLQNVYAFAAHYLLFLALINFLSQSYNGVKDFVSESYEESRYYLAYNTRETKNLRSKATLIPVMILGLVMISSLAQ